MPSRPTEMPLTERKFVRRGLLAGLAAIGAAVAMKVTGVERAEALNNGGVLVIGANASTNQTSVDTWLQYSGPGTGLFVDAGSGPAANGVYGSTLGSGNTGVFGSNYANGGLGVVGQNMATLGSGSGVRGYSFTPQGQAVRGNNGGNGTGVKGVSNLSGDFEANGNGSGIGVHGKSGSGTGVVGESQSLYGVYGQAYTGGVGVQGIANASGSIGVQGQSGSGVGVQGQSGANCGVRGLSSSFVGLVGISDTSIGLYGYNVSPNVPALYAENLGPNNRIAALFNGDVRVMGNFTVVGGAKNAAVTMPDGSEAVLYCQESPEPYFEDFGRARLVNGFAQVQLEPEFASLVKRDDYMVYLTPEGETKGHLFIGPKNVNGFDVREANGGTSSVPFTYRIVAKRKDIEGKRLARLDPQVKANIGQMRSAAAAKNHPSVKVPPGGNPLVPLEALRPTPDPTTPRPER